MGFRQSAARAVVAVVALAACGRTALAPPLELEVSPRRLALPDTMAGFTTSATVSVRNRGASTVAVHLSVTPPFEVGLSQLMLGPGGEGTVLVVWLAPTAGHATGALHVGPVVVPIDGEALPRPVCEADGGCTDAHFDLGTRQCVQTPLVDGTSCPLPCFIGTCGAGVCQAWGPLCDDQSVCTADLCDPGSGCSHAPVACPVPADPCLLPSCDPALGCGSVPASDGAICGPDDCGAATVKRCRSGQCLTEPAQACPDTWERAATGGTQPPMRDGHALAYDAARQRIVLFGGRELKPGGADGYKLGDTWTWDGAAWREAHSPASPEARFGHALAFDAARGQVVLFGGYDNVNVTLADTWTWDGAAWTQRAPAASPGRRRGHGLAYDAVRQRVVLFGGYRDTEGFLDDTWEWDGATWQRLQPPVVPPRRGYHALAYDAARRRVVLFGGTGESRVYLSDTWEWDGAAWTPIAAAGRPPARSYGAVGYDEVRARVVLLGGQLDGAVPADDTWEWDATTWRQRFPTWRAPATSWAAMAYDSARRRMTLVAGSGTWVRVP